MGFEDSCDSVVGHLDTLDINTDNNDAIPGDDKPKNLSTETMQKDNSSVRASARSKGSGSSGSKREDHVGIKHFPSNRIMLRQQRSYYDDNPSLLIIPIMTNEEVTKWDKTGYSAIVLARDCRKKEYKAAHVYKYIGATNQDLKDVTLATPAELEKARALLSDTILGLANVCSNVVYPEFSSENNKMDNTSKVKNAIATIKVKVQVPVQKELPKDFSHSEERIRVRIITFSDHATVNSNDHPAPDPRLLVLKAAANWFKYLDVYLLPSCGEDNEEEEYKLPSKIEFIPCGPTFDESLSDSDESYDE
jgi:hypothetical protein